ncbi:uncharacterized protein STEHIDRAFT_156665 [Stereum hirsutum FP-91666 SS1]|uniref:uncharacterized protein n=1 Tax=Stereum hirsutum (strain FP-91666) TaxID=721885 RepID=UPI000440DBB4|nr:uncharacterized protein STEHIDRAFT_156665 [Stereum hirsutum FP-91666 SS1]EIM87719.1 hypothetical protein STEHIDRAFT_156665 [Stereum hirsutum FP-91666 SS1]
MLSREAMDALQERVERYSRIVRALTSYFRLTARFQFDTVQPLMSLLGVSRPLEVQNYAIQEVWNRIWCWQGMVRWMLMSTEGDGSFIPLSELRLPRDWFVWLRNDHAFEFGHLGAVIRWQPEGGPHPVVNWHLQRNVPMDWIWDESAARLRNVRNLHPDLVRAQSQPIESFTPVLESSRELVAPTTLETHLEDPPSPPLLPELPRERDRRWTEGRDKKRQYQTYWLFSRKDKTRKNGSYRFGKPFSWKKRLLAQELEFAPNFPRQGDASWILDEFDGISEPNTPLEPSFFDDEDMAPVPFFNLTSEGVPTGGGPAPPSPPLHSAPIPASALREPVADSRDSDEELLDYGEFTEDEDFAGRTTEQVHSEEPMVIEGPEVSTAPLDNEVLEEIEAEQLRQAIEASRITSSEAPLAELGEGVASSSRVRLPSVSRQERSPPREPRALRERRTREGETRPYSGKGKQRMTERGTFALRGPRGSFRPRGYRSYRPPIMESSFMNPPEGYIRRDRLPFSSRPHFSHPPESHLPRSIHLSPRNQSFANGSDSLPTWGIHNTGNTSWGDLENEQEMSGWGESNSWGTPIESSATTNETETIGRTEDTSSREVDESRIDVHPEEERILEAAEWHPPAATLRNRLGLNDSPVPLLQRVGAPASIPVRNLEDRIADYPSAPDSVLSLPEAVDEELAQPHSNKEYWPWTGSLSRQSDVRQVVRVRTTSEIIDKHGVDPHPVVVPNRLDPRYDGFLYLDALSAIRAADWRHRHGPDSWEDFVLHAIGSGIPFEWRVSTQDLVSIQDAPLPPPWVHTDPLSAWWEHNPDDVLASYLWAVQEVFTRPNAVRALHAGGLLWRIAVEYGDMDLMRSAVQGPSDMALVYRRGRECTLPTPSTTDHLSDHELNAMLGILDNGTSIWPPLAVFGGPGSIMWDGEWSMENERWFRRRLNALERRQNLTMRENHWHKEVIRSARTPRREPDGPGSSTWASGYARDVPPLARLYRIPINVNTSLPVNPNSTIPEDPMEQDGAEAEGDDNEDSAT